MKRMADIEDGLFCIVAYLLVVFSTHLKLKYKIPMITQSQTKRSRDHKH